MTANPDTLPAGPHRGAQGVPRLDDSFAVRATRRARSINEKRKNAMPPKANTPDLSGLSDDALAREITSTTYTVNTSQLDPHHGRPTREEGLRRVAALSGTIASQTHDLAHELTAQIAKGEGNVATGDLTRYAGLVALADPAHHVWTALLEEVSAPDRADRGPIWSTDTDAEREGQASEARNVHATAMARSVVLADEHERRRIAEADAREVERLQRYRARSGV